MQYLGNRQEPRDLLHPQQHASLDELTRINRDDLLRALGLGEVRRGRGLIERLCQRPARRFAHQMLCCDALVGAAGLRVGAAWALGQFVPRIAVDGQNNLPPSGPLLIVSNHPGLYDALALFAMIPRTDLRIIAADRPFLQTLSNTYRHLLTTSSVPAERTSLIRAATRHLRSGGTLLTFPGGQIEPDPAVLPGTIAAMNSWSASISLFVRLVRDLTVVPVMVSGVLSPAALHHPLVRLRGREHQQLLAATLQIVFPALHQGTMRVSFGRSLSVTQFPHTTLDTAIIAECRSLLAKQSALA